MGKITLYHPQLSPLFQSSFQTSKMHDLPPQLHPIAQPLPPIPKIVLELTELCSTRHVHDVGPTRPASTHLFF